MAEFNLIVGNKQKTKRLGRGVGSGLGKTSGKGHKGQKARSGGQPRRGFEGGQMPLYRRLPKRGFTNIFKKKYETVNLSQLDKFFDDGSTVNAVTLLEKKLIKPGRSAFYIKVLNDVKELKKKFVLEVHGVSVAARELIEKAGGTINLMPKAFLIRDEKEAEIEQEH